MAQLAFFHEPCLITCGYGKRRSSHLSASRSGIVHRRPSGGGLLELAGASAAPQGEAPRLKWRTIANGSYADTRNVLPNALDSVEGGSRTGSSVVRLRTSSTAATGRERGGGATMKRRRIAVVSRVGLPSGYVERARSTSLTRTLRLRVTQPCATRLRRGFDRDHRGPSRWRRTLPLRRCLL